MKPAPCIVLALTLALATPSHAQVRPELASLVKAENEFALMSIEKNVREAFISNFDDETIMFRNGEPYPGRKGWLDGQANDSYLFWWPIWADVSSSGDFGFTTGPAERGGTQAQKKPTSGGYFASVWRKNYEGVWKVVADIGTGTYDPAEQRKEFKSPTYVLAKVAKAVDISAERTDLLELDGTYNAELGKSKGSLSARRLSKEAWVHRPGHRPLTSPAEISEFKEKGVFTLEQSGGDIASSADMGFTYGRVWAMVSREGKEAVLPFCYMRVWKKEGGVWKIIMDVIG